MQQAETKWKLDKTISVTHMFATISAIAALIGFGSNLNTRLSLIEQTLAASMQAQAKIDDRQDKAREDIRQEMRENYKTIDNKLDRLIERGGK